MKIAAYQAPLAACASLDESLALIRQQIDRCEADGIEMLGCPVFVPTNNGLPPTTPGRELIEEARACDISHARQHRVWVVRADVAGRTAQLVAHGSSGIVDPEGTILASARELDADLVVADIAIGARAT
jgi:hypothetical protein